MSQTIFPEPNSHSFESVLHLLSCHVNDAVHTWPLQMPGCALNREATGRVNGNQLILQISLMTSPDLITVTHIYQLVLKQSPSIR